MEFIESITEKQFKSALPIKQLLSDSLYYPSCGFDGGVVKYFSKEVQSFIYCDYATGEEEFNLELNSFLGYEVLFDRNVTENELTPNGWSPTVPPGTVMSEYLKYNKFFKKPFCRWTIYQRTDSYDENHGPKRFSLLYVGGEGVATYNALYYSNKCTAKILAIIQPGTGFGLNWTDFREPDKALAYIVLNNPYGIPDKILYGGIGHGYEDFKWGGYERSDLIRPYYSTTGEVTVWGKRIQNNIRNKE